MKLLSKKGFLQKTITVILFVLCVNIIVPTYSSADIGGTLLNPFVDFFCTIGDAVINVLQICMTGNPGSDQFTIEGGFLVQDDKFFSDSKYAAFRVDSGEEEVTKTNPETIDPDSELNKGWMFAINHYFFPTATYSPEQIFTGSVSGLDVNFINPKDKDLDGDGVGDWGTTTDKEGNTIIDSSAGRLQRTIANWYVALRNLSAVALLSILVYIGIRIIISSTASDKAKYKQFLADWLVALFILFFMHYIMAFTLTMVDSVTNAINPGGSSSVYIKIEGKSDAYKTNLLGAARFKTQYKDGGSKLAFFIMYIALVIYTFVFTWVYLKRLLMMAFLTLISPLVALTYPIDKMGDSKAQAFNSWLREYVFNALIQPFHLIIYMVFVGTAMDFARDNIIYMIAALGFILPAEKILRGFFGFNQASTLGAIAGGAVLGQALAKGTKSIIGGGSGGKKSSGGGSSSGGQEKSKPIRFEKKHGIGEIKDGPNLANRLNSGEDSENQENGSMSGGGNSQNGRVTPMNLQFFAKSNDNEETEEVEGENKLGLSENEKLEHDALGRKLDQMEENGDVWNDPQKAQEFEEAQTRYKELEEKKNGRILEKEQEEKQQKAQEEQAEKRRNSPFTNWTRAHGWEPGRLAKNAGAGLWNGTKKTIGGAAKFATKTTFRVAGGVAAGAIPAMIAMASGGGVAGGIAAFAAGASIGSRAGDKVANGVIGVGSKVGSGVAKTIESAAGSAVAGIKDGVNYGDAKRGLSTAKTRFKDSMLNGTALGRELDLANGNTHYQELGAINAFKTDRNNIQYLKEQMTASGWKDKDGNEYEAGSIPPEDEVVRKMNTFDDYISSGVTDIKQIMSAQKAEKYGVEAKQAAIISSIAKDRGINEDVLLDKNNCAKKKTKLVSDYMNKGYSEANANKQADYVLDVARVQNGIRPENLGNTGRIETPNIVAGAKPAPQPRNNKPTGGAQPAPQPAGGQQPGMNPASNQMPKRNRTRRNKVTKTKTSGQNKRSGNKITGQQTTGQLNPGQNGTNQQGTTQTGPRTFNNNNFNNRQ